MTATEQRAAPAEVVPGVVDRLVALVTDHARTAPTATGAPL
ncbi:hypothetical protein [Geodermatophilus maliterrae]|uniref:Uncharacterized protein n=1 Tax=Geodermatophilus maliterrae TaxID=3162531 RepID=A0ABV3XMT3_9ACTN